jgi:probable F420-dependent oxidoreductase
MHPSLGLFALNQHATPEVLERIGPLAEELGYDSIWMGEHIVAPDPRVAPSPMEPDDPILDSLVALAFLAARTQRIRLATGIIILPQRNPVVLAKQLASLDVVSRGRLVFGMGVGYVEPEMTAIGVPMERRGARSVEYLQAMRALWEQEKPSFEGEFTRFSGVDAHPRPVQRPLPVVMAGHSPAAHRRAAKYADGWYGFFINPDETAAQVDALRAGLADEGRDFDGFDVSVTPRGRIDADAVAAYGEMGVNRLVLLPRGDDPDAIEDFVRSHAPAALGAQ